MPSKPNITYLIKSNIKAVITSMNYILWDVVFEKQGSEHMLTIVIDSENGIDVDDCEKVFYAVDPIIDEIDPIQESYSLQITSPGVERLLRTPDHFKAVTDKDISIKLFNKKDYGSNNFQGKLVEFNEENKSVKIISNNEEIEIDYKDIAKANLIDDYLEE